MKIFFALLLVTSGLASLSGCENYIEEEITILRVDQIELTLDGNSVAIIKAIKKADGGIDVSITDLKGNSLK